jgi:hypothetical protein
MDIKNFICFSPAFSGKNLILKLNFKILYFYIYSSQLPTTQQLGCERTKKGVGNREQGF